MEDGEVTSRLTNTVTREVVDIFFQNNFALAKVALSSRMRVHTEGRLYFGFALATVASTYSGQQQIAVVIDNPPAPAVALLDGPVSAWASNEGAVFVYDIKAVTDIAVSVQRFYKGQHESIGTFNIVSDELRESPGKYVKVFANNKDPVIYRVTATKEYEYWGA